MTTAPGQRLVPLRLVLVAAAFAAAALVLAPLSRITPGQVGGPVEAYAAVALIVMIVAAHRRPIHVGPRRKMNVSAAPEVAAVLILSGPVALLALTLGTALGESPDRVRFIQRFSNVAMAALRAIAGTVVFTMVREQVPDSAGLLLAALAAATVMYLVSFAAVRVLAAVHQRQSPFQRAMLPRAEMLIVEMALSLTGILAAEATLRHAWALPLLIAPAIIAHHAVRDSIALRAQTERAEQALAEANRSLALREDFLSVASHELRTPLTSLKSHLHLARRRLGRDAPTDEIDHALREADGQANRLRTLIDDLLDVSRIAGGHFTFEREPLALGELAERIVETARALEPERRITLTVPDVDPVVVADGRRLEQVLVNLLENAVKYSPRDRSVQVTLAVEEGSAALSVRDEGFGIPPEDQPQIFDRFYRARDVNKNIAGLGLGLYIAQEIVRAHDGTLTVESTLGEGSTFTIRLPWSGESAAEREAVRDVAVGSAASG